MFMEKGLLIIVLTVTLGAATCSRNITWHTLLQMWQDCAAKSPGKSRTHNNLGNCYTLLNRHFPAIAEYQKAVALDPGNTEAQFNLASLLDDVGLYSQAMRPYDVFCRSAPPGYAEQRTKAYARLRELLALSTAGSGSR